MSEKQIEMTPTADSVKLNKEESRVRSFFKKYESIIRWVPTVVCGLLGIVLLLLPIARLIAEDLAVLRTNITGYGVFGYMEELDNGFIIPVIIAIIVGAASIVFAVLGIVLPKFRRSFYVNILACLCTIVTFIVGVGQAAWIGTLDFHPGIFSILCLVFGILFAVIAVGESVIHWLFFIAQDEKILWGARFKNSKGWLYLLPAIIILAIFTVWPIINTIRLSFLNGYNYNLALVNGDSYFSFGIENYKKVLEEGSDFYNCLTNTLILTFITVPISTLLALIIAVALNSIKFVRKIMQTIFFMPYVTNSIAIGMVFMALFAQIPNGTGGLYSTGMINNIIQAFGGEPINWVNTGSDKFYNMFVLVMFIVWNALPFKILVLLGGLQSVNKQYYDAAKIDGTSRFRTFWRITVPLLSPMIAYVVITGFIGGFKEYSSVVGIFGDDMAPGEGTTITRTLDTMVGYIYSYISGDTPNHGRASAAALVLFLIIFAVTMINLYVSKKKVHY